MLLIPVSIMSLLMPSAQEFGNYCIVLLYCKYCFTPIVTAGIEMPQCTMFSFLLDNHLTWHNFINIKY